MQTERKRYLPGLNEVICICKSYCLRNKHNDVKAKKKYLCGNQTAPGQTDTKKPEQYHPAYTETNASVNGHSLSQHFVHCLCAFIWFFIIIIYVLYADVFHAHHVHTHTFIVDMHP